MMDPELLSRCHERKERGGETKGLYPCLGEKRCDYKRERERDQVEYTGAFESKNIESRIKCTPASWSDCTQELSHRAMRGLLIIRDLRSENQESCTPSRSCPIRVYNSFVVF